ncbi:MAG: hypothetical protein RL114_1499 [Actinomycetota bacterium]|jgi:hypothetical protein
MDDVESIISQLEGISERLNDVAMSLISDAIEQGETTRPALEKRVSQARRAVDKAVMHLKHD